MRVHQGAQQCYFFAHISGYYRRIMPYSLLCWFFYFCLKPAIFPMVNPKRVMGAVYDNLLQVLVLEQNLYIAKADILLQDIIYQHVHGFFVCVWKIFLQQDQYPLPEFILDALYGAFLFECLCSAFDKFLPYFFQYYFCCLADICYRNVIYRDRLVFTLHYGNIDYNIIYGQFICIYYLFPDQFYPPFLQKLIFGLSGLACPWLRHCQDRALKQTQNL